MWDNDPCRKCFRVAARSNIWSKYDNPIYSLVCVQKCFCDYDKVFMRMFMEIKIMDLLLLYIFLFGEHVF